MQICPRFQRAEDPHVEVHQIKDASGAMVLLPRRQASRFASITGLKAS